MDFPSKKDLQHVQLAVDIDIPKVLLGTQKLLVAMVYWRKQQVKFKRNHNYIYVIKKFKLYNACIYRTWRHTTFVHVTNLQVSTKAQDTYSANRN